MNLVRIGRHAVGPGRPCFIIAEAGSNHDGKLGRALRLIDAAADAGADAVKFQLFRARTLYPREEAHPRYLRRLGVKDTIYRVIERMEMPFAWVPKLHAHCRRRRILFLATPFDEECADVLAPHVPAFKIASYELTHTPLLEHVARLRKPVILSTGGADVREIDRAVAALRRVPTCLLQCTAKYPAPPEAMGLRAIPWLARRYRVPVGLSDHSRDCRTAPVAAVALGAALLEKHFTLSRRLRGPDHSYAVEPGELRETVRAVREAEAMLGAAGKAPHAAEAELREYRRGVFTTAPVPAGAAFSRENVAVLRRAGRRETDLGPEHFGELLRRRARKALPANALLRRADARR